MGYFRGGRKIMTGVLAALLAVQERVELSNFTVQDFVGAIYIAGFRVNTEGTITARVGTTGSINLPQTWKTDSTESSANYDVRVTTLTGDALDFDENVWLNLASFQQFQVSSGQGTYLVEIRLAGVGAAIASCVATLDAVP